MALRMSLKEHQQQQHISSSSSSSSLAARAPPTLGQRPRIANRKLPRWPLAEFQVPMEKIDEECAQPQHDQIHDSTYVDSSGCTATFITDRPTTTSSQIVMCPLHQLQHNKYCQACVNYQFMKEKQEYGKAMQHSIQDSYDTSSIIFIDELPYCSSHDLEMQEWCLTCNKGIALRDKMAGVAWASLIFFLFGHIPVFNCMCHAFAKVSVSSWLAFSHLWHMCVQAQGACNMSFFLGEPLSGCCALFYHQVLVVSLIQLPYFFAYFE